MNPLLISRAIERVILSGCVPLLIMIGYKLFAMGVTGNMTISAQKEKLGGRITNLAPGSFCFLLGVVLGAYALINGITTTKETVETVAGNAPPASAGTNSAQLISEKLTVSGLGGAGDSELPTWRVRKILSNYTLALLYAPDDQARDKCKEQLFAELKHIPTTNELNNIETLEQKAFAQNDPQAMAAVHDWASTVFNVGGDSKHE